MRIHRCRRAPYRQIRWTGGCLRQTTDTAPVATPTARCRAMVRGCRWKTWHARIQGFPVSHRGKIAGLDPHRYDAGRPVWYVHEQHDLPWSTTMALSPWALPTPRIARRQRRVIKA